MSEIKQMPGECTLWIDHVNRIISFKKADGLERMVFASREDKMSYAYEKCCAGYRVQ